MKDKKEPVLLTDLQIQQFICDGFLVLQADVADAVNKQIDERFNWIVEHEGNHGNNILPRLPDLYKIIDCSVVRGAMISLLGPDYMLYVHRYWHFRRVPEEPIDHEAAIARSRKGSHQDSYPPTIQARSHCLHFLRAMYYSHDVPLQNGPTHVVPGSQYHNRVSDEDRPRQMPVEVKAGAVVISHFDIIHTGFANRSERVRNMMKFIFARGKRAEAPAWQHESTDWKRPANLSAPFKLDACWQQQWNHLCNLNPEPVEKKGNTKGLINSLETATDVQTRIDLIEELGDTQSADAVTHLITLLDEGHQAERTTTIYSLAKIGSPVIAPLIDCLIKAGEENPDPVPSFETLNLDDACHALAAIGEDCISAVLPLLDSSNEITVLSAIHILNDISIYKEEVAKALLALLDSDKPFILCLAANALGNIGADESAPSLCRLLDHPLDLEQTNVYKWPIAWAIHHNAAFALAHLGAGAAACEDEIIKHL
ncbi:MAG: HEAT repeat domain-containing protein, partial [Lentisphaeria bacterium]|nr:phytanoyl-CoA dioxygenase family protein [Lentisphaeria bacterium]NQZ71305.1 HEAT repeat domain-containing protein [Lentisphaeria bacterium]